MIKKNKYKFWSYWFNRGGNLFELGRHDEALEAFNKAIEMKPDNPNSWSNKGAALNGLGRYKEALEAFNKAIEIKPDYPEAWSNKGAALNGLGRYKEALESYNKAIKIKPDFPHAWSNKGNTLADLGRPDEALEAFNKAIEIKPDYHSAWSNKGITLSILGRPDEALEAYNKAIEIKPDFHETWTHKGITLADLGRPDEALEAFNKAIEIKPDYYSAWYNKGVTLSNLGRPDEALEVYNKAIENKPDFHEAWYNKGITLSNLGRPDEANEAFTKAIKIKPDYPEALYNKVIVKVGIQYGHGRYFRRGEPITKQRKNVLRIGIDGRWRVYEMSQMFSALEDLYNFIISTSIIGEKFPPLKALMKEALAIGNLRLREEKFSEFFRTVTKSIEGAELTLKSIQYGSPGKGDFFGLGSVIESLLHFINNIIKVIREWKDTKEIRKLEIEGIRLDHEERKEDIKTKKLENAKKYIEMCKGAGFSDSDLNKVIRPIIDKHQDNLIDLVKEGKITSVKILGDQDQNE